MHGASHAAIRFRFGFAEFEGCFLECLGKFVPLLGVAAEKRLEVRVVGRVGHLLVTFLTVLERFDERVEGGDRFLRVRSFHGGT